MALFFLVLCLLWWNLVVLPPSMSKKPLTNSQFAIEMISCNNFSFFVRSVTPVFKISKATFFNFLTAALTWLSKFLAPVISGALDSPFQENRESHFFFFFFFIFFWWARMCRPLLRLSRPFMIHKWISSYPYLLQAVEWNILSEKNKCFLLKLLDRL